MFDEIELAAMSYRNLQILAAEYRVPGNIKKNAMIKVIIAARKGDDSEVTRLLNELQQTRKKKVQKVKKERKISNKTASIRSTNYRENRYYSHQQKTFRCASNLQIAAGEELSNGIGHHETIPNYEDFHEYLVRVQRDYHFNFNNNMERTHGSPSIVDLRMNEQKTIVHQSLPLDLHRATNILLSSEHNHRDDANRLAYDILNGNDAVQTPLLLKKMLQAPVGTNLKDMAGSNSVYRIFSQNDFDINNFVDDSDTLSAESGSNHNDDVGNAEDNCEYTLNTAENQLINIEQNVENGGMQQLNSVNPLFLNESEQYRIVYQSNDVQQTFSKFMQASTTSLDNNNISSTGQDDTEILKSMYYMNHNSSQEHVDTQANQFNYQVNNYPMMANNYGNNYSNYVESSDSLHCNMYNYSNENNIHVNVNNNMHHNHDHDTYYNNQMRSADNSDYYSQSNNAHGSGIFPEIYSNVNAAIPSEQFNNSDGNVDNLADFHNSNVINNEQCGDNEYNYHQSLYPLECHVGFKVNHENHGSIPINNEQYRKDCEFYNLDKNQTMNNNDVLEPYFPHWKQSTLTSSQEVNLENVLNIRKHYESNQTKIDETSTVFCYSPPIVTPIQLITNANVCTQEKRFFVENRGSSTLRTNSSQVYNDTGKGRKMANSIDNLNFDEDFSRTDLNYGSNNAQDISLDNNLSAGWAIDYSNIRCDALSEGTE